MVHFRYSRWSGSTRDSLDSDSVFDQLNEYMNETGDLQQAMRRLMQKGMKGEKQTKGIEDLLSQVARRDAQALRRVPLAVGDGRGAGAARLDRRPGAADPRTDGPGRARTFRKKNSFSTICRAKPAKRSRSLPLIVSKTPTRKKNSSSWSCSSSRSASWKTGCAARAVFSAARRRCSSSNRRS